MPQKRLFVTIKQSNKLLISFYPIMHFAHCRKKNMYFGIVTSFVRKVPILGKKDKKSKGSKFIILRSN